MGIVYTDTPNMPCHNGGWLACGIKGCRMEDGGRECHAIGSELVSVYEQASFLCNYSKCAATVAVL